MSYSNYENYQDGDYEDREDLIWSESDWLVYLHENRRDIAHFIKTYQATQGHPNHLDEVAKILDWHKEDWNLSNLEEALMAVTDFNESEPEEEDLETVGEVYTFHKNPVYIVTVGLYALLRYSFEKTVLNKLEAASPSLAWKFANSLREGESNALQAIFMVDTGEGLLATAHLKYSLKALNYSFSALEEILKIPNEALHHCIQGLREILFDLREVWLRVMRDCRQNIDFYGELE